MEPHLRYCCSIWGCAGSTEINQLQKLQHRAARILTNSSFGTLSRLLIDMLGFKAIEQHIANESKIMVFKFLHDPAPPNLCSLFIRNSKSLSYTLRNTVNDLKLPKKKSYSGQRRCPYRAENCGIAFLQKLSRYRPCFALEKHLVHFCLCLLLL